MSGSFVLGIDTSDRLAHVVLIEGSTLRASKSADDSKAVERLTELIHSVLQEAACQPSELQGIAVAVGPGSYTGIRAGIACAQGLAAGWQLPVLGVCTILAHAAASDADGAAEVFLLPASRNEYFWLAFERSRLPRLVPQQGVGVCPESDIDDLIAGLRDSSGKPSKLVRITPGGNQAALGAAILFNRPDMAPEEAASCGLLRLRSLGVGLEAIYGKGVAAKTLAERGITVSG